MSKPPSKGETPILANTHPPGGKTYMTQATTAATVTNRVSTPRNTKESPTAKDHQGKEAEKPNPEVQRPVSDTNVETSPLQKIATAIGQIISKNNLDNSTKQSLEDIVAYIRKEKVKEDQTLAKTVTLAEESTIRKSIRKDLMEMYTAIEKRLNGIQETTNETLTSSSKLLKDLENVAAATKDLTGKVSKITDTAERIAMDTSKYRNTVLTRPTLTIRATTDPKVLGDLERKCRQILVEHLDTEGTNLLSKSLTELTSKANKAISTIEDLSKPKDIKVQTLFKTCQGALVLTLDSKEAVAWIKQPENEIAFTMAFAEGSHIAERSYSLITLSIPILFNPKDNKHLRKVEEANRLSAKEIIKAKWIKPIGRRRPDQTHAFVIITLSSADSANVLIRDGMNICNARVRPKKQKVKPVQCMKCRKWGHFASNCQADKDTCGTCGDSHQTNACTNQGKVYCVSCCIKTHSSWDRACLEFNWRCEIQDERNLENAMPFYPTDHDWMLTARPHRIPLDECFPGRYAVNSLPTSGLRWPGRDPHPLRRDNRPRHNATLSKTVTPICTSDKNRDKEEGELFGVDDHQNTDHGGRLYMWTNKDEEEYQLAKSKGW